MRVLVTAASKHGATLDIATLVAAGLTDAGIMADVLPPDQVAAVDPYDACIVGSAVYAGHWLASARVFVNEHAAALSRRSVWLFSSGPLGDPPKPEGDPVEVAELMRVTGAREHRIFPGRIDRHALGLGERLVVAAVRAPDGDFRVPVDIEAWAGHIARTLRQEVPAA